MLPKPLATLLLCCMLATPGLAQDSDLDSELSRIETSLAEVDATLAKYSGGLIHGLAAARREALLLARQLIENQQRAERGDTPLDVTIPATKPDPELAAQILEDMVAAQQRIDLALSDASETTGLVQAVARSRVETERLSLAQLQMAYLQAKYGIAIPVADMPPATTPEVTPQTGTAQTAQTDTAQTAEPGTVAWADARYPDVDYTLAPFELANRDGGRISGWWTIEASRAPIDDSLQITAINYSAYDARELSGFTALVARCIEGESALIFVQSDYLVPDLQRNSFAMTLRIDDQAARADRWSALTTNKGAGLFGAPAQDMMRALYDSERVFLRLTEKNGRHHDALFQLAGQREAFDAVAGACGWTTLSLSGDDRRAIQKLLNAGGFEAGAADGQWGPGSRRAMAAFQASEGLPETGLPDRATLQKLGYEF